ncbi:UDP-N-acetylmuramoyl-L-alanyl-D-glutamate--2,6-diaminopimelate ligase [Nitratifractor salsuginis]|uniref:UDP-N-acetylmuramoyl-L-alanyl-D-glutamate--2,6-diaminopimelate ligase n=1 Tax=Nitratifractor salsuginis (strain DSM 16511 / JCM 12458 / E9I37-1) TaxID=749222 RepID=E6WYM8_NITSE|nr:UDP-N-acetylmuramoyl-L-alanyl-D-glutamate--2,6-diaminopimelate ligase [Nitratifractor salsuginis]ADV45399.1 UDP-N-acetylmuramoylalanyl-D-glutamate--2,6-diaminopimelate ligase [Nitratifractor salsuginis DSM 16511]
MIVPIEEEGFGEITDNTRELKEGRALLATAQNAPYRGELTAEIKTLTPEELIDRWGLKDMKVIGVTGTNGKTTTTALIYSLLIDLGYSAALQGTRGLFVDDRPIEEKHMTTPSILETLWNMKRAKEAGAEYFVMEVSSHAIDQDRIEGLDFALKVHTNVTRDHLDYHGTLEEYRRVKSLFFSDDSLKLLNKDEIKSITFNPKNAYTYGVEEPATFKVLAYSLQNGISAVVQFRQEQEAFFSNMMGLFNLYNLLAAIASVKLLTDRPLAEICDVVENFGGVSGRMEVVSAKPTIIVDFAHTDDGMYRVLDSLKDKDLVVVFGAGGDRDRGKRPRMGAVAGRFAKKIYVTSDNPRSEDPEAIIAEILQGLKGKEGVRAIVDRREAIERAIDELQEDEILLILGKGDESTQEIAGVKHPFDDREVVRQILEKQGTQR